MDRSRDFDTKEEAFRHASNNGYQVVIDQLNSEQVQVHAYPMLPNKSYKLVTTEEGLYYWEIY